MARILPFPGRHTAPGRHTGAVSWRRSSTVDHLPADPVGEVVAASITEILEGASVDLVYYPDDAPPPPAPVGPATVTATGHGPPGLAHRGDHPPRRAAWPRDHPREPAAARDPERPPRRRAAGRRPVPVGPGRPDGRRSPPPCAGRSGTRSSSRPWATTRPGRRRSRAPPSSIAETIEYLIELSGTRVEAQDLTHGVIITDVLRDTPRLRFRLPRRPAGGQAGPAAVRRPALAARRRPGGPGPHRAAAPPPAPPDPGGGPAQRQRRRVRPQRLARGRGDPAPRGHRVLPPRRPHHLGLRRGPAHPGAAGRALDGLPARAGDGHRQRHRRRGGGGQHRRAGRLHHLGVSARAPSWPSSTGPRPSTGSSRRRTATTSATRSTRWPCRPRPGCTTSSTPRSSTPRPSPAWPRSTAPRSSTATATCWPTAPSYQLGQRARRRPHGRGQVPLAHRRDRAQGLDRRRHHRLPRGRGDRHPPRLSARGARARVRGR